MYFTSIISLIFILLGAAMAGFNLDSKENLAVYWGQNSAGGTGGIQQDRLSIYCADPDIDVILLAFLVAVNGAGGQPQLNFANQEGRCDHSTSPFRCPEIEADIKECQGRGKTILLSLGGANSPETGYRNEADARAGAEKLWQMFGPDQSTPNLVRPFGSASVDGFDLDFEQGIENIVAFGNTLRGFMDGHQRKFYLSAAPVCANPQPNGAVQEMIDHIHLDMVFVQFYNNPPCDIRAGFNFERWNSWAREKNTIFLVGLPAREQAAPSGGYVPPEQLRDWLGKAKSMDRMRGAMLWDASQAWFNNGYHHKVKEALK